MTDLAQKTAFDPNAPQDERNDAMGLLQKAHLPTTSDMLPQPELKAMIEEVKAQFQAGELIKSSNVVQFPAKREKGKGMQSLLIDDWQISVQGDWYDRPGAFGFDLLRAMVEQTPILNAVVMTRVRQVQRFCRMADTGLDMPGFEIRHIDKKHALTAQEQKNVNLLDRFITNCGWESNPRKRRALKRDTFPQTMGKLVRDTLTLDAVAIETEWKQDNKGLDGFYAIDGGSIRLCTEDGYRGDDEIFAVQVVQSNVRTAYTFNDLIYEPRNPRTDLRCAGYGLSETELLVRVVTGFLNAMTVNIKGFDANAIPKGMLHLSGNFNNDDINAFKRQWNATVNGVQNAWALPLMVSKDQESKANFEKFGVEFNEMMFAKWMTFLTSIICAIYGMSPSEINFDSFTGGNTSALSGNDTAEKLAASKDSGLRPILAYFENLFTDYVIGEFDSDLAFRWTGLDPEDQQRKFESRKLILTVDEMRAEEGYEKLDGPLGAAPLNSSLIGPWMQFQQPEAEPPQAEGKQEGEPSQAEGDLQKAKNAIRDFDGLPFGSQPLQKSYGLPPLTLCDTNWWAYD